MSHTGQHAEGRGVHECTCVHSDIETENLVLTPRRAEDEEQIDLDPEQLIDIHFAKTAENATSSRRLDATSHRES